MSFFAWVRETWAAWREPLDWANSDAGYPDSYPGQDEYGVDGGDTQPTSPGALDSLPGDLCDLHNS
jgi:hypothetical protein